MILALAFYLLRDGPRLSGWIRGRAGEDRVLFDAYARAVDADLAAAFFGNVLNAILTGIIGALAYALLNEVAPPGAAVPYPALVGLLTGVVSLVPVARMKRVYVPLTGYLLVRATAVGEGFRFVAAFFAVSFVAVHAIPDFVLRPYVSGRNLHVGSVTFAYIFGPLLFGWYGIFLGPMLLVLTYHFAVLVLPELLGEGTVRPAAVDPAVSDPAARSIPERIGTRRRGGTPERSPRTGDRSLLDVDVLALPLASRLELPPSAAGQRVEVRPPVALALLDEALLDEGVEVGVEPPVVDLLLVVVLEFLLDRQPVGFLAAGDDVQQVPLEPGKIVHVPWQKLFVITHKRIARCHQYTLSGTIPRNTPETGTCVF